MKVKHTQNGNVKITLTADQAIALNWVLTSARVADAFPFDPTDAELAVASEVEEALNEAGLF